MIDSKWLRKVAMEVRASNVSLWNLHSTPSSSDSTSPSTTCWADPLGAGAQASPLGSGVGLPGRRTGLAWLPLRSSLAALRLLAARPPLPLLAPTARLQQTTPN